MRTVAKRRFIALTIMALFTMMLLITMIFGENAAHQIVCGIGLLVVAFGTVFVLKRIQPNFIKFGRDGYIK